MQGESIRIDGLIIDPAHIIMIDSDAQVDGFGYTVENAVRITLAAISGEFGAIAGNSGSWEAKTLLFTGVQAEALRPWLAEMFPCEGRSIRLPEVLEVEEGSDEEKEKRCFQCDEVITVPFNDNFCAEVCARVFVDEIPF